MKKYVFFSFLAIILATSFLPQLLSNKGTKTLIEKKLSQKTHSQCSIHAAHFCWLGPQKLQVVECKKDSTLVTAKEILINVPFWNIAKYASHISIDGITITNSATHETTFEKGFVFIESQTIQAKIQNGDDVLLDLNGSFISPSSFQMNIIAKNLPTVVLDIFNPKLSFSHILGSMVSGSGYIQKELNRAKIDAEVSSPLLVSSIALEVKNGQIQLLKPFLLQILCQDFCQKQIFLKTSQNFIQSVHFENPITLTLPAKDFFADIDIDPVVNAHILDGEINLGKMELEISAKLTPLLELFRKAGVEKNLSLWITPVTFSLDAGILNLKRVDLLLNNSLPIFLWGQANLKKQTLDMTLAIPGKTISKIYKTKKIPANYNLLMKISGTFENPVFDIHTALAKLALIQGIKQGFKQIPGPAGTSLGTLVDIFNEKSENIPPPSHPIPWQQ